MTQEGTRLRLKTWICVAVVVCSNALGDFFMKRFAALFQPWVVAGIALLILWQMSRMALLSWADLSYVLPVTSIGYVAVALLGKVMLNEQITARRWTGITLIAAGVALVSGGVPLTPSGAPEAGASR